MTKNQKITIEEFLQNYNWEIKELIDNITGEIHQKFPNIKEKIKHSNINYTDAELGKIIQITPEQNKIEITLTKQKQTITIEQKEFQTQTHIKKIKNLLNQIK